MFIDKRGVIYVVVRKGVYRPLMGGKAIWKH